MATGITQNERHGHDACTAPRRDPGPVPPTDAVAELRYTGKQSEHEVLRPFDARFRRIDGGRTEGRIVPNAFVLGDNFASLHHLLSAGTKVALVYLDPPYGTGMQFHTRHLAHAYNDISNSAQYIEALRRRLILVRELLTDSGSLYVHIGHQMVAHVKIVLDEVFGQANFRNLIARRKCSSKNFTSKQYSNLNDYLLFYSRTSNYTWNQPGATPTDDWIAKEYPKSDDKGRRYKLVPIHAPGTRKGATGEAWKGMMPPPGKHWQYTPARLDELDSAGEIYWSRNGNPRRKVFLENEKSISYSDYWQEFRDAHHQSIRITGYPTEKNLGMLRMIIGASSNAGDLVLDPYCGSGTTLHAAEEMGRKWIGLDESFVAARTVLRRMRNGLAPMGDYVNGSKEPSTGSMFAPEFSCFADSGICDDDLGQLGG